MRFLHSGDFHIASSFEYSSLPSELNSERRMDIWRSIEELIRIAKDRTVEMMFLTGDLFNEEYVTLMDLKRLTDLFTSIKDTKIFVICGNHDPFRDNSKWKFIEIPENVYIFKNDFITKYEFGDYDIYGISFIDNILNNNNLFEDILLKKNKKNIFLIHSDLINPNFRYQPIEIKEIKKVGFDYIALGHLHKASKIFDNCYYPGSIEPLSFKEQGLHGAIFGEFKEGKLEVEFLDISQSIFMEQEFFLEGRFDFYKLRDELLNNWCYKNKKNYIRIILKGYIPDEYELDEEELINELKEHVKHLEIINELDTDLDLDRLQKLNEGNIIGIYIENMLKKDMSDNINKDALKLGIKALLRESK